MPCTVTRNLREFPDGDVIEGFLHETYLNYHYIKLDGLFVAVKVSCFTVIGWPTWIA